jgi:hypothetical protein
MVDASQIREHMEVKGSDGKHVGTVDRVEGDRIKLSKNDPQAGGRHHYIPAEWVERADGDQLCLRQSAREACSQWTPA